MQPGAGAAGILVRIAVQAVVSCGVTASAEGGALVPVLDYSGLSPGTLQKAMQSARRVYESAGIRSEWASHSVHLEQAAGPELHPAQPGQVRLIIRLIPSAREPGCASRLAYLGYALISKQEDSAALASVCTDRVRALSLATQGGLTFDRDQCRRIREALMRRAGAGWLARHDAGPPAGRERENRDPGVQP